MIQALIEREEDRTRSLRLDPDPTVSCDPASGTTFPIGTTTVECAATDSSGNSAKATFDVVVKGAAEQIGTLKETVAAPGLERAINRSLQVKLDDSLAHLNAGRKIPACKELDAFKGEVSAHSGKKINAGDAQGLTADAAGSGRCWPVDSFWDR